MIFFFSHIKYLKDCMQPVEQRFPWGGIIHPVVGNEDFDHVALFKLSVVTDIIHSYFKAV